MTQRLRRTLAAGGALERILAADGLHAHEVGAELVTKRSRFGLDLGDHLRSPLSDLSQWHLPPDLGDNSLNTLRLSMSTGNTTKRNRPLSFKAIRDLLVEDNAGRLQEALEDGLNADLWLDADPVDSLLSIAVLNNSVQCVEILLSNGGDWALSVTYGEDLMAPFALALQQGSVAIVRLFLNHNSLENYSSRWREDVVAELVLCKSDTSILEVFESLVALPDEIVQAIPGRSLRLSLERKAIDCLRRSKGQCLVERWQSIRESLAERSMDLSGVLSRIEELADNGHITRLMHLLKQLPAEAIGEGAGRALVYAARLERGDLADQLMKMGADWSVRVGGTTALMEAVAGGNLSLIRKFLEAGANPLDREDGPYGRTVLEFAPSKLIETYLRKQISKTQPGIAGTE